MLVSLLVPGVCSCLGYQRLPTRQLPYVPIVVLQYGRRKSVLRLRRSPAELEREQRLPPVLLHRLVLYRVSLLLGEVRFIPFQRQRVEATVKLAAAVSW